MKTAPEAPTPNIAEALDPQIGKRPELVFVEQQSRLDIPPQAIVGTSGLRHASGFINEEQLSQLRYLQGTQYYKAMWDDSAVIGSIMFIIMSVLRQVKWSVKASSGKSPATAEQEFLESNMGDMEDSWGSFICEVISMLVHGWSLFEIVFKLRKGEHEDNPMINSQFKDGRFGLRSLEVRSQDTLYQWALSRRGDLMGVVQMDYWNLLGRGPVYIPKDKLLHFKTRSIKGNPEGYALALDTPVPTPNGWSTMGDLKEGDKVYGDDGRIRYVVAKSEIFKKRPTYEIEFSSGHRITADANHLWSVLLPQDKTNRATPRVARTEDLFELMRKYPTRFWRNPIDCGRSPVLDAATLALPVDPYLLGYWLGDGCKRTSVMTVCKGDVEHLKKYIEDESNFNQGYDDTANLRIKGGFKAALRCAGVLEEKHIPAAYLRAAPAQRLALLQGLMDTDGHCTKRTARDQACVFHNTNKNLIDGVAELVRSLGGHPSIKKRQWAGRLGGVINGKQIVATRDVWEVRFWLDLPAFLMPRKLERQAIRQKRRRGAHTIRRIVRIEDKDTVCVQVDSPSHLFLVGEEMVPTHNSLLRPVVRAYHYVKRLEEIEAISMDRNLSGMPVMEVPPQIMLTTASSAERSLFSTLQTMVQQIKVDQRWGAVIPASVDNEGKPTGFKLNILSAGGTGSRQSISEAISRYNIQVMQAFSADFIQIGQSKVGTQSLFEGKSNLFLLGLTHYLDLITETLNRTLVPKIMRLNGVARDLWPEFEHGKLDKPDLEALGTFLQRVGAAGLLSPNRQLEAKVLELVDLPVPEDEDTAIFDDMTKPTPSTSADRASGLLSDEQTKAIMDVNEKVNAKKMTARVGAKLLAARLGMDEQHASEYIEEAEHSQETQPGMVTPGAVPPGAGQVPAKGVAIPQQKPNEE